MKFFARRQKNPYGQIMMIMTIEDLIYQHIDPEDFLFPPQEIIPPRDKGGD